MIRIAVLASGSGSNLQSIIGCLPMITVAVGVFVLCIAYSVALSFTDSRLFPKFNFIGFEQYRLLWETPRWIVSVQNIWLFGLATIVIGHFFGQWMTKVQPMKMASAEALCHTEQPAGFSIFAVGDVSSPDCENVKSI